MPDRSPELTGYVLAGGRSSRMGTGKADLRLGGHTLLAIACAKLAPLCREVVVVGTGEPPPGVRGIADLHPGCGPIGGMEAALRDLPTEFAAFLPVDMPLLPPGLLAELARRWSSPGLGAARVCFAVFDGVAQPLVSRLHREVLPMLEAAISAGELKLRPVLERAAAHLGPGALERTEITTGEILLREPGSPGRWTPPEQERSSSRLWFSNLNTPEEFRLAEACVRRSEGV